MVGAKEVAASRQSVLAISLSVELVKLTPVDLYAAHVRDGSKNFGHASHKAQNNGVDKTIDITNRIQSAAGPRTAAFREVVGTGNVDHPD